MNDEEAFLARIRETPDDVAPRLVYADWLDEHDDPRGELIRVTEEMRPLAPYSDAYWALKPRRKTLRDGVVSEWLETLRYNDVLPVLSHGVPDDHVGRWRLLRELLERWRGFTMRDVGQDSDGIAIVEKRIGQSLAPTLREWVALMFELLANSETRASCNGIPLKDGLLRPTEPKGAIRLVGHPRVSNYGYLLLQSDLDADKPPVFAINIYNGHYFFLEPLTQESLIPTGWSLWDFAWQWCWQLLSESKPSYIPANDVDRRLQQLASVASATAVVGGETYYEATNGIALVREQTQKRTAVLVHISPPATNPQTHSLSHGATSGEECLFFLDSCLVRTFA